MQLGQFVDGEFGLLQGRADDLVADPVVGHVFHEDQETVAVEFRQVGGRAAGAGQGVEFGEVAHLPLVEVEAHGDLPVGGVLRCVLGDEGAGRIAGEPVVGGRQPGQLAHHAHSLADLAGRYAGNGRIGSENAVFPQGPGQPLRGQALGHGRQGSTGHGHSAGSSGEKGTIREHPRISILPVGAEPVAWSLKSTLCFDSIFSAECGISRSFRLRERVCGTDVRHARR